uniref:Nucleotide exchange factor Fes1 domain-containing protein n=1 Tax=Guillardia theta TaxID=55529 RepID=A0A7S4KVT2_GUITH
MLDLHSGRVGGEDDAVGETERVKAISAISALIQHNDDAIKAFLWAGGLDNMRQDLHMQVGARLRGRACFVLQWLFESSKEACKQAVDKRFAPLLFAILLESEEIEYAGRALRSLVKCDSTSCAEQIRVEEGEWRARLNRRLESLSSSESEDERQIVEELVRLLS